MKGIIPKSTQIDVLKDLTKSKARICKEKSHQQKKMDVWGPLELR